DADHRGPGGGDPGREKGSSSRRRTRRRYGRHVLVVSRQSSVVGLNRLLAADFGPQQEPCFLAGLLLFASARTVWWHGLCGDGRPRPSMPNQARQILVQPATRGLD